MLKNTFCHVPGVGTRTEARLWREGFLCWDDLAQAEAIRLAPAKVHLLKDHLTTSRQQLRENNPRYFMDLLPPHQVWRLFGEFQGSTAYLDIETTGLDGGVNHITTIALYDGQAISYYIQGRNLDDFRQDIQKYRTLVTYNGRCFDIPFIRSYLNLPMEHAHIDLRYVLRSLGFSGGLKGCERQMGIDRGDLVGVDGYFAVLLWDDFVRNKNPRTLETLLAYNIADVVNLEILMVSAYNLRLKNTPFSETHQLEIPSSPEIPFQADLRTLDRVRDRIAYFRS